MARIPRLKKSAKKPAKALDPGSPKTGRRGPSALAAAAFVLIAGVAATAGWLHFTYVPIDMHPGPAEDSEAMMSIDLSQEGSGQQADRRQGKHDELNDPEETDTSDGHKDGRRDGHGDDHASKTNPSPEKHASKETAHKSPPSPAPQVEDKNSHKIDKPEPKDNAHKSDADQPDDHKKPGHEKPGQGDKREPAKTAAATHSKGGTNNVDANGHGAPKQTPPKHGDAKLSRRGSLSRAPDPALIKAGKDGPLPIVAADGRTPLQVYARPYKPTGRPRVAVVVGSLGLSQAATLAAIQQLPGGVTLAFAPYGRNLQDYVNQARAAGHEVMLQVPMEPMDYPTNDPGPHTLLTSLTIHRNLQRLDWLLGRFTGYVGVVNFMGGRFTAAQSHLLPVLEAMRDRGLMFLDARASSTSVAKDVASQIGLYVAANDRVLDAIASRAAIDARLLELERLASASGGAVGIGFPYPVTIERLAQWTWAMGDRGFDLVPISALTDHQKKAEN